MKTVYLTHHKLVEQITCIVFRNEADLQEQISKMEQTLKETPFLAKTEKDKAGKPIYHELSKHWPEK